MILKNQTTKFSKLKLGKTGEEIAQKFFESNGFSLIEKNFRFERAETDLIFKNDFKKLIIFAEVKTRTSKKYGEPEESITEKKAKQLIKSAQGFIFLHPEYEDYEKRFDIVSIVKKNNNFSLKHLENII